MYVVEDGPPDGPPILLVHGVASSWRAFDRLTDELPDRHVIRVDLLGHGRTGGGAADAITQADAIAGVLHERDLHDVTAVGHSYGADVVLALAAATERVEPGGDPGPGSRLHRRRGPAGPVPDEPTRR